jgi:glutathione S-transferase
MSHLKDVLTSSAMTFMRGAAGHRAVTHSDSPAKMLVLYEFEACPYCRRVREALSALDLEAIIVPCPRGSQNREAVIAQGGKAQFPFLVDPNTQRALYESSDICAYLEKTYGHGAEPWQHRVTDARGLSGSATAALRPDRGLMARGKVRPEHLLELWSYEASPYSRLVREVLCELELPYVLHNVPRHGARRQDFVKLSGKMQVPYLQDPNTGAALFESQHIIEYLEKTYGQSS